MHKYTPLKLGLLLMTGVVLLVLGLFWQKDVSAQTTDPTPPDPAAQTEDGEKESSTADHSQFEELQKPFATGPEVTAACLSCHTEAASQLHETVHWNWEKTLEDGQVVGKNNVVNNYCVAVSSNEPRCTSCHIGYGYKDGSFDFSSETAVDCLVCHDTTGQYKKFPAGAGHPTYETKEFPPGSGKVWEPLDLSFIAQNVGDTGRSNCGACHFYGGGGDGVKHGDLDSSMKNPSYELDVHLSPEGEDFACTACHQTEGHNVSGSRYEVQAENEAGQAMPIQTGEINTCESCHGLEPMQDKKLNDHVDNVACQTCHIPEYAREQPTKMFWDWSTAGQFKEDGSPIVSKDDNGWVEYNTKKGNFDWGMNVEPEYYWYNGKANFMVAGDQIDDSQVVAINAPFGSAEDEDARIWPFKRFRGIQPYDVGNQMLAVPHLFGKDEDAYWKSYDWDKAINAGMNSAGLNYSGEYDFVESEMYWPITHMVAPAEKALDCEDCHSQDGRLANIEGVYMPATSRMPLTDLFGQLMIVGAVVGIAVHGGARYVSKRNHKVEENAEDQS